MGNTTESGSGEADKTGFGSQVQEVENNDPQLATLAKLRQPEAAPSRTKLRKTAEAKKTDLELKPCQNLTGYELKL